jgi:hypothetical protein
MRSLKPAMQNRERRYKMSKTSKLDDFTTAYLIAALWATYNVNDECKYLDEDYDIEDFSEDALESIIAECVHFQEIAEDMIGEGQDSQAGHDFFLTRNSHGVGFWDRPEIWGANKDRLAEIADSFGEMHVYPGDDGRLYI